MEKCNIKICEKPAKWSPVVLMYALRRLGPHGPIRCVVGLKLCDDCRKNFTLADLGSQFGDIVDAVTMSLGKARVDRSRTQVEFVECDEAENEFENARASARKGTQ